MICTVRVRTALRRMHTSVTTADHLRGERAQGKQEKGGAKGKHE